jgi:hypothetical protein
MSPLGPKRTYRNVCYSAALGGKADISQRTPLPVVGPAPFPLHVADHRMNETQRVYFSVLATRTLI